MKRNKFIAILLIASLMSSTVGCSKQFDDSMASIADKACKNVVTANYKKVESFIDGKNKDLERAMDLESEDETINEAIEIILSTLTYEVDEDSLESDFFGKEGTIDVTFSIVDYESVLKDNDVFRDIDEFEELIGDCKDTIETPITLEFEKIDGDAVIVNSDEFVDLFAFKDIELTLAGVLADHILDFGYFTGADYDSSTGEYTDTNVIELVYELDELGTELDWDYSFEVQYGDYGFYSSGVLNKPAGQSTINLIYEDYTVDVLEDGMWFFTLYDGDGNSIYVQSADVTHTEPEPEPEPVPSGTVDLPYYVDINADPFVLPGGEYQVSVPVTFTLLDPTDPLVQTTAGSDLGSCTCAYMTNPLNLEYCIVYLDAGYVAYFRESMADIAEIFSSGLPPSCVVQESYMEQRTVADQTVDCYIIRATTNSLDIYYVLYYLDCGDYGFFVSYSAFSLPEIDNDNACISHV